MPEMNSRALSHVRPLLAQDEDGLYVARIRSALSRAGLARRRRSGQILSIAKP